MDELKEWFREGLAARIDAFESARMGIIKKVPRAIESVRRLSYSLHSAATTYGFPAIMDASKALEEAKEEEISIRLDELIVTIRKVALGVESPNATILIVEDDPDIHRILQKKLSGPSREVLVAETANAAKQIIEEKELSLIILDLFLPDDDGRNILLQLRERTRTDMVPVIVLSAQSGVQPQTECFALGADAYFSKPFSPNIVAGAVSSILQRVVKINKEARKDSLTGLPNRAAFNEAFERSQYLASREDQPLYIAIIDIDHFKSVNDTYGHSCGDDVLTRIAFTISRSIKKSDFPARWGGEEFVILLPDTDEGSAIKVLERVLAGVREEQFQSADGETFHVTFSAGLADVKENMSVQEAVAEADRFLYLAKDKGRNQIISR